MKPYAKTRPVALKYDQDKGPEPPSVALASNLLFEAHAVSAGKPNLAYAIQRALRLRARREDIVRNAITGEYERVRVRFMFTETERRLEECVFQSVFSREVTAAIAAQVKYAGLMRSENEPQEAQVFTEAEHGVSASDTTLYLGSPCPDCGHFLCNHHLAKRRRVQEATVLLLRTVNGLAKKLGITTSELLRSRGERRKLLDALVTVFVLASGLRQVDIANALGWSEKVTSDSVGRIRQLWSHLDQKDSSATASRRTGARVVHTYPEGVGDSSSFGLLRSRRHAYPTLTHRRTKELHDKRGAAREARVPR